MRKAGKDRLRGFLDRLGMARHGFTFERLRESGMRRNDAVKAVAEKFGMRKNDVYRLLVG